VREESRKSVEKVGVRGKEIVEDSRTPTVEESRSPTVEE